MSMLKDREANQTWQGLITDHLNKLFPMTFKSECQLLTILFRGAKNNVYLLWWRTMLGDFWIAVSG